MKTKIFSNEFNEVIVSEGDNFFDERGQFKKTIYGKNIIIVDWSGWGEIVSVILEQKGEFWDSASSGVNDPDKIVWSSHSKCWFN